MNYNTFIKKLKDIEWFINIGKYEDSSNAVSNSSLDAWDSDKFNDGINPNYAFIAANMDWLPTTRDQINPINSDILDAEFINVLNGKKLVMAAYKIALKSLRSFNKEKFKSGPNNFSESAKGAALYCIRMAAKECLLDKPGFWTNLFSIYVKGHWPCGLINNKIVVY